MVSLRAQIERHDEMFVGSGAGAPDAFEFIGPSAREDEACAFARQRQRGRSPMPEDAPVIQMTWPEKRMSWL